MSNSQAASQSSWTNVAELGAVAASFGGTVAAVLMQQVAFAAVPLSLAAALSICNRRQAVKQLSREVVHLQSELNLEQQKLLTLKTNL